MTTIAAIIVGLASGYFLVRSHIAYTVTAAIMIALTALQTLHLASGNGTFSKSSVVHDVGYWVVCVASIGLALVLTWVGTRLAHKRQSGGEQIGVVQQGNN